MFGKNWQKPVSAGTV